MIVEQQWTVDGASVCPISGQTPTESDDRPDQRPLLSTNQSKCVDQDHQALVIPSPHFNKQQNQSKTPPSHQRSLTKTGPEELAQDKPRHKQGRSFRLGSLIPPHATFGYWYI